MIRIGSFFAVCLVVLLGLLGPGLGAQTVYLTPEEALKLIFPGSAVAIESKTLTPEQKKEIDKLLGAKLKKDDWGFYVARSGHRVDGYALLDTETGKTEPITFMTAILPSGRVKEVEVLIYREAYGSEVRGKGFLKQFEGKGPEHALQVGKDIGNITGATLSSQAVTRGVKRALILWKTLYGVR